MNTATPVTTTVTTPVAARPLRHPAIELLARYTAVFKAAWAHRAELAGPQRLADEAAFLPAALSLQDTPVHPAPRRLAGALIALFVLALVWAVFGQIDIVAVAPGRIIVSDRTKVIQPLEASVVKSVRVKDGDRVQAGQVLVELDPTMARADTANVQEQLQAAASEAQRTAALLPALASGHPPSLPPGADAATRALLQAEWQDIGAKLAKLDAEAERRQAETATVQAAIAKLEATVPMARQREADFRRLVDQGYISGHATQDKTRERVELEQDLVTQRARLAEAQSARHETQQTRAALRAETQRQLGERHAQARTRQQQLIAEDTKARQRERLTQLTAPVAGVVQQLAIHSVGGVVTPAQPLMIVVPDSPGVSAEVAIANLDIGFVNAGQSATVKLETFPYTRYGTVVAQVSVVSADAVTDEKKGSYYPAVLTLSQKDMAIDGKRIPLSPGMNLTAEIKTGHRRVIDYLLSPVQRAGSESLRER
ncbi:MAG: HlyD family type I secretion periplasmic adaptor subunit [Burkholderiaceae bacterium]|nr:HlyD family type I secretion periplasmic adaptor subunit [Burkholderiaceae bacterium]